MSRLSRSLIITLFALAGMAASATDALASHFRYGTITWSTPNPAQPNVIQVRFDSAWRWSFFGAPTVGQTVSIGSLEVLNTAMNANVVSPLTINAQITGVNGSEDWINTTWTATITLPPTVPADYILRFTGCCRVSTLRDGNADTNFTVLSRVTVRNPINRPPTSASLPIVTALINQPLNFVVPAFDPDGDALTYVLSPIADSGMTDNSPSGALQLSVHPTTGVVTWIPNALGLYATQFKVTDSKGAFTVIDIIYSVIASGSAGLPPLIRVNGSAAPPTFNVLRGSLLSFNVVASTNSTPATPVTLNSSSLPAGATMTPSLPTSATGNVSSNFTWIPTPSQVGSYIVTYAGVSGSGLQSLLNVNINVTNNVPTIVCSAPATVAATSPSGAIVNFSAALADIDDDLLNYQLFIDGLPVQAQNNINGPASIAVSTSLSLGVHTYQGRVTDNFSPTVLCSGTITVVDQTPPTLLLPPDQSLFATSDSGAVATFTATATDTIDTTPTVACVLPSGSTFPLGSNTVTCTAADDSGNSVSGSFTVNVSQAATSLTTHLLPDVLVGGSQSVQSTLGRTTPPGGPLQGEVVTFTLTSPSSTTSQLSATTNAGGTAFATFPITQRGTHIESASFAGANWLTGSSSSNASFGAFQRTALTMGPGGGFADAPVTLTAVLTNMPQGTPVVGETVLFSFGGVIPQMTATTDGAGIASVTVAFPEPGSFAVSAAFSNAAAFYTNGAGALPPQATMATDNVTIAPAVSSLSLTTAATGFVGNSGSATATLLRVSDPGAPMAGQIVTFTLTGPVTFVQTATTDSAGVASVTYPGTARGVYTMSASFNGTISTAGSTASSNVILYQRTTLLVNGANGAAGSVAAVSALLTAVPQGTPVPAQVVNFDYAGVIPSSNGLTDSGGTATVNAFFPSAGSFPVTATFSNLADYFVDAVGNSIPTTGTASNTIIKATTSIAALTIPAIEFVGNTLPVVAQLSRVTAPAGPVNGATVTVTVGSSASAATTDAAGVANVAASLTDRGATTVVADYAGNASLSGSSASASTTVYQRTMLTLAPAITPAGSAATLAATLTTVPGGAPVAGQQVMFEFGGLVPSQSATTDAFGVASVSVTFATAGSYTATASFTNVADYFANRTGALAAEAAAATVLVTDSTPPVIVATAVGSLGNNGYYTSNVDVSWSVTDGESAATSTGCGLTTITSDTNGVTVTCSATSAGGSASESVTIKRDATNPVLNLPANLSLPATTSAGATVAYTANSSDATSGIASFSCVPASGSQFAIQTTTVNCTTTDNAGHVTTGAFTVSVTDTITPVITSTTPSVNSLWPPNHQMVPITIAMVASDNLGPAPACSITGVTSNEPQNGLGDGDTPNDWLITGPLTLQLRAERAGGGNGRVYSIAMRCVDVAGNAAASSTTVSVPKSQKK